jgi:tartrate dehydrogenase/decarboxylase/D-malate dehydrogenase
MMLQHLGHQGAHDSIMQAVENVLRDGGCMTADMGGNAKTVDLGKAIAEAI